MDIPYSLRIDSGPNLYALRTDAEYLIRDLGKDLIAIGPGAIYDMPTAMKDALLMALIIRELHRLGDIP